MAFLICLEETSIGIPLPNSYARITMMRCDNSESMIQVSHYANEAARRNGAQPIDSRCYTAPASELQPGPNPIAIAYAWLRTQPEYAGAECC